MSVDTAETASDPEERGLTVETDRRMPSYVRTLFLYCVFNACSFGIILGSPLVLLVRFLGADESVVGILISLVPFLSCLQFFATEKADKWGYRKLLSLGWAIRNFMILPVVALPLLVGRVSIDVLIGILFLSMFAFNTARGFSVGAWFPWLKRIIPEPVLGRYLGYQTVVLNVSLFVTTLLSAVWLEGDAEAWQYSALFGFAVLTGFISVYFLLRTPCPISRVSRQRPRRSTRERIEIAKKVIWRYKPFRRVSRFGAVLLAFQLSFPGFVILYLRDVVGWSASRILYLSAFTTLGVLFTALIWGKLSDRVGSRPLLRLAISLVMILLTFWMLCSLGLIEVRFWLIVPAFVLFGVAAAAISVPQLRLLLACCPRDESTLAAMVYQVVTAITSGTWAIAWGFALKWLRDYFPEPSLSFSPGFAAYFSTNLLMMAASQILLDRIQEKDSAPAQEVLINLIWGWPVRFLSGVLAWRKDRSR